MSWTVTRTEKAGLLPPAWDSLAPHYFQQTSFLAHAERYNPCRQRYYQAWEGGLLKAGAVVYTLKIDLLTYPRIKSPVTMQVTGIPCSVSCPGIFGDHRGVAELKKHLFSREKGFKLALNLEGPDPGTRNAFGHTLPAILLENRFSTWEAYRDALRADYRRRLCRLRGIRERTTLQKTPCAAFTGTLHQQYLQVLRHSHARLETLPPVFFRELPAPFELTVCSREGVPLGWTITLRHGGYFSFFMGGTERRDPDSHEVYLLLLEEVVRDGIRAGAQTIDLGQTAEIPKMRMGGLPSPRYMEACVGWPPLNRLLKSFSGSLEYRAKIPVVHVFHHQP